jgi:aminoglycoside phosphotransferase (APT) family kinase protein
MSSVRLPWRAGRARGLRYGEIPADIAESIERWLLARHVDDAITIKDRRVYRRGPWLYKFFAPRRRLRGLVRPDPAIRSADQHARLAPIRTPAPLVALGVRDGLFRGPSLLVMEFVEGERMAEAFARDEQARIALARLLAAMHRRRIFHGDFHPANLIWDGQEWVVIDVGALRHPLRTLRPGHLAIEQWAELDSRLGSPPELRALFELYLDELGASTDRERAWRAVALRSKVRSAQREERRIARSV